MRAYHLAKGLAAHAQVTLLSFGSGQDPSHPNLTMRNVEHSPGGRMSANLAAPSPALPLQIRLFLDSSMRKAVNEELALKPDVVHVTLSRMGPYLPEASPGLHRHLDLVDSLSFNMRTRAKASSRPAAVLFGAEARLMARYEAKLSARADSVSLVSDADRRAPGLACAAVVPNGIDTDVSPLSHRAQGSPPVLTFFGNLGYFHNSEPARFVAEDVLPLVRAQVPGATLRLAGARPSAGVKRLEGLEGVELHADVPDMAAELANSTVALLPMFTGSGLKNKVLEAFAAGLPVVANPNGMDGVEGARTETHFLAAESAGDFAASTVRLIGDAALRAEIASAARKLVSDAYSWERQVGRLLGLYGTPSRQSAS